MEKFKGIALALSACFIWGFIFIVPQFMDGFSSFEICIGRYAVYGLFSLLLFGINPRSFPFSVWKQAAIFSLVCTLGYYLCVIFAMRYSNAVICSLVLGVSPITIAFLGNWKLKECSYKSLIIPSSMIFLGLIIINVSNLQDSSTPAQYLTGLLFSLGALAAWSWCAVINSHFLKTNASVLPGDWTLLIGVTTLFWVVVCSSFMCIFFPEYLNLSKFFKAEVNLSQFLAGSALLGIICSWLGSVLWNLSSLFLPVSLAGQITIFETIFSLLFIFILKQTFPAWQEATAILLFISAVTYSIRIQQNTNKAILEN